MKTFRIMAKFLWRGAQVLAGVLLAALLGFGLLQTRPLKNGLAAGLERLLSREGRRVHIGQVRGLVPFDLSVDDIRLADGEGDWLAARGAHFRLAATNLLKGRITVREMGAAAVRLQRRPAGLPVERRGPPRCPSPYRGPEIEVEQWDIGEGVIEEAVAGERIALACRGRAQAGREPGLRLFLQAQRADTGCGRARVTVQWRGQPPALRFDVEIRDDPEGPLARHLPAPIGGPLQMRLSGEGPPEACRGRFDIQTAGTRWGTGTFTLDGRPPMALKVNGAIQEVDWPGVGPLERVEVKGRATGLQTVPEGTVQVDVRNGQGPWRAKGRFRVEDGRVRLSDLSAQGAGMTARGTLDYEPGSRLLEGKVIVEAPTLETPGLLWGWTVGGRAVVTAAFSRVDSEQQVVVEARLENPVTPFGRAAEIHGRAEVQQIWDWPNGRIEITAREAQAGPVNLSDLAITLEGDLDEFKWQVAARGAAGDPLEAEAQGSWFRTGVGSGMRLDRLSGRLGAIPIRLDRAVTLTRRPGSTELGPWTVHLGAGRLEGAASLAGGQAALRLAVTNIPLPALARFGLPRLEGIAGGQLTIEGPLDRPVAEMNLKLDDVAPAWSRGALTPVAPADVEGHIRARDGRLVADLTVSGWSETPMQGSLEAPLSWSLAPLHCEIPDKAPLAGHLRFDADLAPLLPPGFLEDQVLRGRIEVELQLEGTPDRPDFRGRVALRDGYYEHLNLGTVLTDLSILAETDAGRLVIRDARAGDGGRGRYALGGRVQLAPKDHFPFSLQLRFQEAALARQDRFSLEADGAVALDGSLTEARLTGQVNLREAEYRIGERLPPEMVQLEVTEINQPVQESRFREPRDRWKLPLRLDLEVRAPARVFVRGRGLDSEWSAALRLTGEWQDAAYAGSLDLLRGRFLFLGRRFTLERGLITWHGEVPPEPQLDILASTRAAEVSARLALTGSLEAPAFELTSDPALPPDEIMARLLFGRSADRISPAQALRLAYGLNLLRGGGSAFDVLGRGQSLLRVDQLDLKQDAERPELSAIAVGKYLGDRLYLQGEKSLAGPGDLLLMEVELTPALRLQTETGPHLREGVRLNWSRDY